MPRTLEDWLDHQQRLHPRAMDFTLDRVRTILARLGLLDGGPPTYTVAGTNGKGSVTALIESVQRAAGRRTGLYTSPHLARYQERIRIDGREIDEPALLAAFERVEAARGELALTYFEYGTAAALAAFDAAGVGVRVLEVGLGGRLDAVNAVDPDVAVVTSIGLDHCEYLGDTLEAIGAEKAGIFRPGRPALFGSAEMPASVAAVAARVGARLERLGTGFAAEVGADGRWSWRRGARRLEDLPPPALAGAVQYANAATALAALDAAGALPGTPAVARGLESVRLAGRFDVRPDANGVEWVFDVAHNAAAATVLSANLRARPAPRTWFVAGILRDKDAPAIARALGPATGPADDWCAVTLDGERGTDGAALADTLAVALGRPVAHAASVEAGCERAATRATAGDRVVVFGSFHTVGPALGWHHLYCAAPR
jgi:dihydrofolate synthase/folylpolyglutamate synthase